MNNFKEGELDSLKSACIDILALDDDFYRQKMKEEPDEIIETMRMGFLALYDLIMKIEE